MTKALYAAGMVMGEFSQKHRDVEETEAGSLVSKKENTII